MLNTLLEFLGLRKSERQLEDEAAWCPNSGEPRNAAANELCRRWGEWDLLDSHPAEKGQTP